MDRRCVCYLPILFALLGLTPVTNAQSQNLFSYLSLNTGANQPRVLVGGDFNGDGFQDIATIGTGNSIAIFLGKGDGNFQAAVDYPVTTGGIDWIATGDFNRDGHLDLAVSTEGFTGTTGGVQILLGKGDGTFSSGGFYNVGLIGGAITTGDFDGDGIVDLALLGNPTESQSSQSLIVLYGYGDGTFGRAASYAAGVGLSASLIAGDFNRDGRVDLALYTSINGVSSVGILINIGASGFQLLQGCPVAQSGSLVAADFNHDGKLDLAAVNSAGANSVTICEGNGDGTFSVADNITVGNEPFGIAAGDLNGDGEIDLVVTNAQDGTISVLLGNGNETFKSSFSYKVGNLPLPVLLADENGDGKLDAAVANFNDGTVQVLLGDGNGKLRAGTFVAATPKPVGIANADFNHDGIADLVTLGGDGSVTVSLGDGFGGFHALSPFQGCPNAPYNPQKIVAADINGDGKPDLATLCYSSSNADLSLFSGNGDGTFTASTSGGTLQADYALLAADVNGDGIPEVVVSNNSYVGYFNFAGARGLFALSSDQAVDIEAGDFNGDGKTDLLLSLLSGQSQVFFGDGHGNFNPLPDQGFANVRLTLGDFNGDGFTDVELGASPQNQVELSNGDGTFRYASDIPGSFYSGTVVADFNGDGVLDLVSPDPGGGIFLGQEDGTFVSAGALPVSSGYPTTADFDGNGSPDVAVLDLVTGMVSILLNKKSFDLTATSLSQGSASVVAGQPLSLSASVVSKNGTPTGSVTFKQAGIAQSTVALVNGTAQAPLAAPAAIGQYSYTALYTGDGTFSGSLSQRLSFTVTAASTTTVVTSSGSPSKLGIPVTFTATIHPQFSGQPTGTVEFYADGSPVGSATVSNGQATFATATLPTGTHTIEADYSGDTNFVTSLGSVKQKVGNAASSVALTSSLNPSVYGQPVTLTALVSDSGGTTPGGIVVFAEPGVVYGTVTLSGGEAKITLPTIAAGKHTITAQYGGDSNDGSAKASLVQVVTGAPSSTTVSTSAQPSIYGQSVTFTAVIASSAGTPDGTVTFKNGSPTLGTVAVSGGQATLAVSTLTGGAHTINAVYSGSGEYAGSSGSVAQVVEAAPTTLALTSSLNPAPFGQTVTITATVTSAAAAAPTGKVTIKDGNTVLGTPQLVNGVGQISTSLLAAGSHNLTATYAGNASYLSSTAKLGQTIQ